MGQELKLKPLLLGVMGVVVVLALGIFGYFMAYSSAAGTANSYVDTG